MLRWFAAAFDRYCGWLCWIINLLSLAGFFLGAIGVVLLRWYVGVLFCASCLSSFACVLIFDVVFMFCLDVFKI